MIEKAIYELTQILLSLKDAEVKNLEKLLEAKASIIRGITLLKKAGEEKK